jgi:glycosyltransferase involved in cell wall biosynthesis
MKKRGKLVRKRVLRLRRRRLLRRRRARSRKPQPKILLVLDHFVPHYDKDTGSRTLFQYIRLFLEMGFRVRFAGYDSTRYEPYTSELTRMGVQVLDGSTGAMEAWLRRNGKHVAYAYVNRPHVAEKYFDQLRRLTNAVIVYNAVDLGYLREMRRAEVEQNPEAMVHAQQLKAQELHWFRSSDVVCTVSEYEKAVLESEIPGKRVVAVPTFFYNPPFPLGYGTSYELRTDLSFVGGFNHSPNADGVFWFVREVLPLIQAKIPNIRFNIIGSNPTPEIMALEGNGIHVTGYVPDEELERLYGQTRVVVAPLRYGAGVKGKVIEAVARGIPVVTTSIGVEGITEHAEVIAEADTPEEFAIQVADLYENQERWLFTRGRQTEYSMRYLTVDYARQVLSEIFIPPRK